MESSYSRGKLTLNPAAIFIVAILVLIIGGGLIFYLQNNQFQKVTKSTFKSINVTPFQIDTQNAPDLSKGLVEVNSETQGYKLNSPSLKSLTDLLYSWGVFNRTYDLQANGKNTGGVNKIVFILTNKPQDSHLFYLIGDNKKLSTVGMTAKNNEIDVSIYVSQSALPEANKLIASQALFGPYTLTHPHSVKMSTQDFEKTYSKTIMAIISKGPLFVVSKVK